MDKRIASTPVPSETTSRAERSNRMNTAEIAIRAAAVERTGGCLCGKIRPRMIGDPRVRCCHCGMCGRATGSVFAMLAWLPSADVSWLGEEPYFRRSSPLAKRGFCRGCGSPLTFAHDAAVNEIALHVGPFDNPAELEPQYNCGSSQRLSWIGCGVDQPHLDMEERW
ncbi:GFA family protein [Mesorhizobium sp. ORM6]